MTRIKVAVRVRPLSNREVEAGSGSILAVESGNTIAITNTKVPEQNAGDSRERVRRFTFDYCFQENSTQDNIFEEIENVIGQSMKRRFHSCVLAYGQSSSGKTHTMMGFPHDPGLTPKLCRRVFNYLEETAVGDEVLNLKVTVSYLEIYNEKVRDLLRKEDSECVESLRKIQPLKIREHPKKGPYVQGLSQHSVTDSECLLGWLERGNKHRRVAATLTNPRSSRSHSVFTVSCDGVKLHLIDLAGSERAGSRCYGTSQFREGANINKSLVALGNVISALAEQTTKQAKGIRRKFVPYRDSVLTWLLKDTLGGNSNTVMVATVSPSSACYSETVNTLRFGQRAKLIVSHPVVNEDPKEKTIRELRAEIAKLRDLLKLSQLPPQLFPMSENKSSYLSGQQQSRNDNPSDHVGRSVKTEKEIEVPSELNSDVNADDQKVDRNSVADQPNTSTSNQSLSEDSDLTLIDTETLPTDKNLISETTTEKLLPLLNISTSVKPTKLRRTFSVDHTYINKQKQKMFGSQESIPSTSADSRVSHGSSSLEKQKSQETISRRNLGTAASTSLLRRRSLNRSNPMLPKATPKRRSLENNLSKTEKATTTEGLNVKKVESKVNSIRRQPIKPRSHIVAAVTSRLYSKTNRKEAATSTDDLNVQKTQVPKELTICTNARSRLRDITRKALKAYKQRNGETQTDKPPVIRVKEISTDVNDLKTSLEEMKDAGTQPIVIEKRDASVNCTFLDQFSDGENRNNRISLTRSCATQSSQDITSTGDNPEKENAHSKTTPNPISFTKYLRDNQDPKYEITDVIPNAPIYTRTVNINISHNYITESRGDGSVSDDSIEQNLQNACLPTPDLISNHNSLEQGHDDSDPSQAKIHTDMNSSERINYANTAMLNECFIVNEDIGSHENRECTVATCSVVPRCNEKVQSIDIEKVQAPQICLLNKFEGICTPLPKFEPDMARPKVVESKYIKCDDCIKIEEPLVLKSIVKQLPKTDIMSDNNPSSSEEDIVLNSDIPDSLDYHMANAKKVKFNRKSARRSQGNGRMLNAMSEFLEEATNLMNNLTMAASKIGSNNLNLDDSYEFEVTVNDVRQMGKPYRKKRRRTPRPASFPATKQTTNEEHAAPHFSVNRSDCSTQCEIDHPIPINKYEALVEESCRRLEEKIDKIPTFQQNINLTNSYHHYNEEEILDPYFGYNPWEESQQPHANDVEDSSLESNPVTYSDYGSLPRKTHKRHRTPTCSPSAFLRQLTNMRRQIIESSREEFLNNSGSH